MKKPIGECPFCKEKVQPKIIEENMIRRDVCECPECHNKVLICRTFGCENYAKSGKIYDDELCPSCAAAITSAGGNVAKVVAETAAVAAVPLMIAMFKGKK